MKNSALQFKTVSATDSLREAVMALQRARIETASLDARVLLQHVLGISREQLFINSRLSLTPQQGAYYQTLIDKRSRRQPVSQLTGAREFWGMMFKVTPATLDPRPDSETLVEAVLEWVGGQESLVMGNKNPVPITHDPRPMTILDLGTGTGCLLLTLLKEYKHAQGTGVDISSETLTVARDNAAALGLARRAKFMQSSWAEEVEGIFDIIVSNPPYIPTATIATLAPEVAEYEPKLALDGGEDGLDCYRAIMQQLPVLLAKDGLAVFEIGMGQEKDIALLAHAQGLRVAGTKDDLAQITRCVLIQH